MRYILFLSILFFLFISFASADVFEHDLYFGMSHNSEVMRLQTFLAGQNVYQGPENGNFFSLTREAVARFQQREDIKPSLGYFGSKTRARVNMIFSKNGNAGEDASAKIAKLTAQILELQSQLRALQTKQAKESKATSTTPVAAVTSVSPPTSVSSSSATTTPGTTTPIAIIPNAAIFSGESTTTFPATTVTPLKIGDIVIRNGTNQSLLFSQLVLDIQDSMNSPLNRRGTSSPINLLLRNGSTTADEVIEKKSFSFRTDDPMLQESKMHRYQINLSYPKLFVAGETKSVGFWIENFEYVVSGSLKFSLYDVQTTRTVDRSGNFSFVLTK